MFKVDMSKMGTVFLSNQNVDRNYRNLPIVYTYKMFLSTTLITFEVYEHLNYE
jgi:hypothetical protein